MMLSFIVPVYKTPIDLLQNCIRSILAYKKPMELICVLDSPGDASESVLDKFARKDPRIRIIKNDVNRGVSYSRNRGLEVALGSYIAFVDSDDEIVASAYEAGLCLAAENECKGLAIVGKKDHSSLYDVDYGDYVVGTVNDNVAFSLVRAFCWAVYPMVLERSFLNEYGFRFVEGHRFGEDFMFVTQMLTTGMRFGFLNKRSYITVGHPASTCRANPCAERYIHGTKADLEVLRTASHILRSFEIKRWYIYKLVPDLFEANAIATMSFAERLVYSRLVADFCQILVDECGDVFTCIFSLLLRGVLRFPRLWILPGMPCSRLMRLLCHFKLMTKRCA